MIQSNPWMDSIHAHRWLAPKILEHGCAYACDAHW